MDETTKSAIQTVAEIVVAVAVPVLLRFLVPWLKAKAQEVWQGVDTQTRWMIAEAISLAVAAAEQSGLAGHIADTAEAKKRYALSLAERYLSRFGVEIDLDVLADMIEAAVWEQFNSQKTKAGQPLGYAVSDLQIVTNESDE